MADIFIDLKKKPKGVTLVQGFPGFGLIGTITTEFLLDTLKAEQIGTVLFPDIPSMVAIHDGKLVNPIGIFYDKKTNLVILHVITSVAGIEWKLSEAILDIAKQLDAKEIISLEGVASPMAEDAEPDARCFFYTTMSGAAAKFQKSKTQVLKEGIIIGVTGALLIKESKNLSCVFVETHTGLPDSKAAAEIIKVLDVYLGLKLDPQPLMDQAKKFEEKLRGLMEQTKMAKDTQQKKSLNYVG